MMDRNAEYESYKNKNDIEIKQQYRINKKAGKIMEKIASFTVNHLNLLPGVYVSRKDNVGGNVITTFDLRMTRPNYEPVMNTAEVHTIEHLAATFLRNHKEYGKKIIYFGPMGCRTGAGGFLRLAEQPGVGRQCQSVVRFQLQSGLSHPADRPYHL